MTGELKVDLGWLERLLVSALEDARNRLTTSVIVGDEMYWHISLADLLAIEREPVLGIGVVGDLVDTLIAADGEGGPMDPFISQLAQLLTVLAAVLADDKRIATNAEGV